MARRDRNAALAGLAALGALMYARSRKKEGSEGGEEEVKPVRTTTTAPKEEPMTQGAVMPGDEVKSTLASTKPAPAKPTAPAAPAAPAAGSGRSAGIGGPTAAQMAQAAMGAGGGRGGQGGPRIGEREAYAAAQRPTVADIRKADVAAEQKSLAERQKRLATPGADAIESVYPEAALVGGAGGVGVKAMHGAAKNLAQYPMATLGRAAKEGIETAVKSGPKAGMDVAQSTARGMQSRAQIQANRAATQRAEAQAMEEAKPILQARPGKPDVRDRTRFNEDEAGFNFKKGGKAKPKKMASGGMAKSSVSKRADGIAKRGKTRGKMY